MNFPSESLVACSTAGSISSAMASAGYQKTSVTVEQFERQEGLRDHFIDNTDMLKGGALCPCLMFGR